MLSVFNLISNIKLDTVIDHESIFIDDKSIFIDHESIIMAAYSILYKYIFDNYAAFKVTTKEYAKLEFIILRDNNWKIIDKSLIL
jgi:hypothetical protein